MHHELFKLPLKNTNQILVLCILSNVPEVKSCGRRVDAAILTALVTLALNQTWFPNLSSSNTDGRIYNPKWLLSNQESRSWAARFAVLGNSLSPQKEKFGLVTFPPKCWLLKRKNKRARLSSDLAIENFSSALP